MSRVRRPVPLPLLPLALLALLVTACGGGRGKKDNPEPLLASNRGAPIDLSTNDDLDEIARLEDARSTEGGLLLVLADNEDARVRRRAIQALGRLPYPEVGEEATEALTRALEDEDSGVRYAAAFGLGLRGDPASAGVLAAYRNDPDPKLRARVVEAASRLPVPVLYQDVVVSLRDADLGVRIEAAVGTARWDPAGEPRGPDPSTIDRALLDALRPYRIEPTHRTARSPVEAELVWRILYALSRRGSALGRGAFLEYADSDVPLERLFAVRGLAKMDADEEVVVAAVRALGSNDWRIAYEATVALGQFADPAGLEALLEAVEHDSSHVRAGALSALGAFTDETKRTLPLLRRGMVDLSASVRNAALVSLVRVVPEEDAIEAIERVAREEDPILRLGAVDASREMNDPRVTILLLQLAGDPSLLVATRAVEVLGGRMTPDVRSFLHATLDHVDNGMRLAAVLALREAPDAADIEPLVRAFRTSTGDISQEVAFNALHTLGAVGDPAAREFVRSALEDPRPHVRRVALEVLQDDFDLNEVGMPNLPLQITEDTVPIAGRDYPLWQHDPLVEVTTSRGSLIFELFPAEAPGHVVNFLDLAQRGQYDGLIFHRVVPDFVVQGGDYRGDGSGGRPWRGESLRHEIGPRRYVRGSLGMPRNEDVDSGGSQFFVTHRPTPHLDGRYTIFGELRAGGDVLDRLEIGDRILGVRLLR